MIDEARLRKTVEKRIKTRKEFYQHLVAYLLVNVLMWGIWRLATSGGNLDGFDGTPWPLLVTGFWGVGLALHFFEMLRQNRGGSLNKELQLEREINAEREKLRRQGFTVADDQAGEKPKRHASISDDGELEYADDREQPPAEKPKIHLAK
jgi:hypothetical protein